MAFGARKGQVSVLRGIVALAGAAVLCFSGAAEARVLLTLDDFGAVGDGIANDTQAFVDAWTAACGSEEQAVLAVPVAKAYQIWPVQLSGPCKKKFKLLIAGTIVAPASPDEWAGRDPMKWLYIYGVDGLSVSGGGTIDGVGQEWWARSCKRKKTQPCNTRPPPRALHFEECRGVSVQGVTLQNGPQFHLSFTRCVDVKANFLRVVAPADSPNTDGIHLNDSSRVQITDNLISTGDDCVSMVGNCSDVRVRDISCGPGHGISIGSLGKNRTTDRVENVRVDTCLLTNTTNGVRIKSWQVILVPVRQASAPQLSSWSGWRSCGVAPNALAPCLSQSGAERLVGHFFGVAKVPLRALCFWMELRVGKRDKNSIVTEILVKTLSLQPTCAGSGWHGLRSRPEVREHRDEERVQPHHHRPVLLRPADPLREPDGGGGGAQGGVRGREGHVGDGAGDQDRVQRHRAVHRAGAEERQRHHGGRGRGDGLLLQGVGQGRRSRSPGVLPRQGRPVMVVERCFHSLLFCVVCRCFRHIGI